MFSQLNDLALYGNPLTNWLAAIVIAGMTLVAWRLFRAIVIARSRRLAAQYAEQYHVGWASYALDALDRTRMALLLIVAVRLGSLPLELSTGIDKFLQSATIIALFVQAGLWLIGFYDTWYEKYRADNLERHAASVTTLGAARFFVRLAVWIGIGLLALDNIGVNISTLITGLGIGGIAVALATQNILGDVLASLSIIFDKPFVVGDFLVIGDEMGTVENIGLKTTRVRSLSGEQLILSNSDLLSSRIRNYGRMYERRIVGGFGITYQTPLEKIERIPQMAKTAIEAQSNVRFDRAHFKAHGASSLDFEYVYYVLLPDYGVYMDVQQAINLALHRKFLEENIEFAYPTQTIFLEQPQQKPQQRQPKRSK